MVLGSKIHIFLVALVLSAYKPPSSRAFTLYLHSYYVNVRNNMGTGKEVMIGCHSSRDGHFVGSGIVNLKYGQGLNWKADFNPQLDPVNFTCDMNSLNPHVHGKFNVFNSETDFRSDKCGQDKCLWDVKVDGIWVYIESRSTYRKIYDWTPTH